MEKCQQLVKNCLLQCKNSRILLLIDKRVYVLSREINYPKGWIACDGCQNDDYQDFHIRPRHLNHSVGSVPYAAAAAVPTIATALSPMPLLTLLLRLLLMPPPRPSKD